MIVNDKLLFPILNSNLKLSKENLTKSLFHMCCTFKISQVYAITVKKIKQHLRRIIKKRNMYVSIIYEQSWGKCWVWDVWNYSTSSFSIHFQILVSPSIPTYRIIIMARYTHSARHYWGLRASFIVNANMNIPPGVPGLYILC